MPADCCDHDPSSPQTDSFSAYQKWIDALSLDASSKDEVIRYAETRKVLWHRWHTVWTFLHYSFNILAVTLTIGGGVLAAILGQNSDAYLYPSLAWAAAILVAALAFLTPSKQARLYITAWRRLDNALLVNLATGNSEKTLRDLLKAVYDGEQILGEKDPY